MNIDSSLECFFSSNEIYNQNFIESIEKDSKKLQDFFSLLFIIVTFGIINVSS